MDSSKSISQKENKKPHVEEKDFYYSFVDCDDDVDGFIHIVSTIDGSELRVPLSAFKDYFLPLMEKNQLG